MRHLTKTSGAERNNEGSEGDKYLELDLSSEDDTPDESVPAEQTPAEPAPAERTV